MIMMKKLLLGVAAVLIMAVAVTCNPNPTPLGRIIGITVLIAKHYFNKKPVVHMPDLSNPETVGDLKKYNIHKRINTNKLNNIGNKE